MTTSTNLNLAQSDRALSSPNQQLSQLSLPTGPFSLVRPRRERTGEDERWYTEQFKVDHDRPVDSAVYMRLAYYGSLNVGRLAYPSMARLARECSHIHVRTAQRALRRLEARGVVECLNRKGGHKPGTYLVVGGGVVPTTADCRARGDRMTPNDISEGKNQENKNLLSAVAQTLDPVEPEGPKEQEVLPTVFPSRKQENAPVPETPKRAERRLGEMLAETPRQTGGDYLRGGTLGSKKEPRVDAPPTLSEVLELPTPAFKNPAQVGMLYSVARKLDYSLSDAEALRFDALHHADKKVILDRLLEEEQDKALHGEVAPPPKKPRAPRAEVAVERKPKPDRPSCVEHRWTEPASDGISNCANCDAEKTNER